MVVGQVLAVNPVHPVFGLGQVECAAARPRSCQKADLRLLERIDTSTVENHYDEYLAALYNEVERILI